MTNSICCLVKIIEKDERVIAAVQFGIKLFNFFTGLNSLLIIFIQVYTVNYQNALDRLRVRMNIILLFLNLRHFTLKFVLLCFTVKMSLDT